MSLLLQEWRRGKQGIGHPRATANKGGDGVAGQFGAAGGGQDKSVFGAAWSVVRWVLGLSEVGLLLCRTSQQSEGSHLVELFFMGLLGTSQELSSFFPSLCANAAFPTANIYALGYLLPGLHIKAFFLLLG